MPRQALSERSLKRVARTAFKGLAGVDEMRDKLTAIMNGVTGKQIKEVYLAGGTLFANEIRRRVPVRTGLLKSAIFAVEGPQNKPNALVGIAFGKAPHAHLVEFGTARGSKPRPFFRPSLTAKKAEVGELIIKGFRKIIDEHGS